ncbi:unnamed protein product [Euphydryas editha]|uniref:Uncharacterized protein n=1 Tax=Euphydryas editha TaxID=104508 RepID=A0AAU9U6H2_EUPED|nr:unnamed protein product [Euphydryas editha]
MSSVYGAYSVTNSCPGVLQPGWGAIVKLRMHQETESSAFQERSFHSHNRVRCCRVDHISQESLVLYTIENLPDVEKNFNQQCRLLSSLSSDLRLSLAGVSSNGCYEILLIHRAGPGKAKVFAAADARTTWRYANFYSN